MACSTFDDWCLALIEVVSIHILLESHFLPEQTPLRQSHYLVSSEER